MLGLLVITLWCAVATTAVRESQPQILPEPGLFESACFGNAHKHVSFQFHCTRPESVIAVSSVKAAAKPSSKNCFTVLSSGIDDGYYNRCCTVDPDTDCSVAFRDTKEHFTYKIQSVCNGHHKCPSPVRVQNMPVREKCQNNTVFPENSNYMTVDYFCIIKSKIAVLWSSSKRLEGGQSVYLQSAGYPCNSTNFDAQEWCKIDVSDTRIPIQVMSIDVQLAESARIVFKDAQSCKESNIITYQNNNKYQLGNIFNLTNNVLLSYKHGAFSSGRFWIGFVSNQNLSISCGITIDENCTTRYLLNSTSLTIKHNNTCSDDKITDRYYTLSSTTEKTASSDQTIISSTTTASINATYRITRSPSDGTLYNNSKSPSTGPEKFHTTHPHTKGRTSTYRINTKGPKDSAKTSDNNQTPSISAAEYHTKGSSPDNTTIIGSSHKKDSPKNSENTTTTQNYHVFDSSTYTVTNKNYKTSPPTDINTTIYGFHTTTGFHISGTTETSPIESSATFGLWWIALVALIITFIVIAVFVYRIQKRKRKVSNMNVEREISPEDAFSRSVTPDERNLIAPCKTTIDIFIPEKRNNALPKIGEGDIAEEENMSNKRDRKKKRKKKKNSIQREENELSHDNVSKKDNS